jgi:hypothetical protein
MSYTLSLDYCELPNHFDGTACGTSASDRVGNRSYNSFFTNIFDVNRISSAITIEEQKY